MTEKKEKTVNNDNYMYISKTRDAQRSCSLYTDQCPTSVKAAAAPQPIPHVLFCFVLFCFFFHTMSYGMEYPFVQFRSAVLVLSHPNCLVPFSLAGQYEKLKNRNALSVQHCSATTETLVCYQLFFS